MFARINAVREVLYSIARYCRCSAQQLEMLFEQEKVYPDRDDWHRYLQPFLLLLSGTLFAAGIIFFFAYNWAEMHKFVKLGLLQGLLLLLIGVLLFVPMEQRLKSVLLTVGAILIGVLYAVFGQIYQTGANAYDFFLGWTLSIFLWALAGRTAALWLVFLVVLNLTLHFYAEQVAPLWPDFLLPLLLFLLNAAAVAVWEYLWRRGAVTASSRWFATLVALAAILINTVGVIGAVYDNYWQDLLLMLLMTVVVYGVALWYAQQVRGLFYPAACGLSVVAIGTAMLAQLLRQTDELGLFVCSLFVIGSTTALVYYLMYLNKKWYGKQQKTIS